MDHGISHDTHLPIYNFTKFTFSLIPTPKKKQFEKNLFVLNLAVIIIDTYVYVYVTRIDNIVQQSPCLLCSALVVDDKKNYRLRCV